MSRERIEMLLHQKDQTWAQEGWFVPLADALEGVGAAEAAWQPPGAGNTIWQTVNHCNYYNERLLCKLTGRPYNRVANNIATFGEPGNPGDAEAWAATLAHTRRINEELRTVLAELTDADLDREPLNEQDVPAWVMHDAYHAGQIVLIRKMQGSYPAARDQ
ncbi:MAG TPA: DinB family protein [Symbiobacteriaceae bacterium]|nr:DinB family protein [Symbiobacteriaceae bacterium]